MGAPLTATPSPPPDPVRHRGGPLLITGVSGTGKSTLIRDRFTFLVREGAAPERIAVLVPSANRAEAVAAALERTLPGGFGELAVGAPHQLAAALLGRVPGYGHLPDAVLSASERLALLSERIDELPLSHHDLGGNPSALLAGILRRIDVLKAALITAARYDRWAAQLDGDAELAAAARTGRLPVHGAREREFAALYGAHDRILAAAGLLDRGDLIARAIRVASEPGLARDCFDHLLVDDAHELSLAASTLARVIAGPRLTVAGDPTGAIGGLRGAGAARLESFVTAHTRRVALPGPGRRPARRFWAADSERAQAQAVAREIEALLSRPEAPLEPAAIAVAVPSVTRDGPALAAALQARAVPHRLVGEAAFFARTEIRDLIAWLRLLSDPTDAPAVVRALVRPPVELRSVDVARVTQIARRRKLDMVSALSAATESPQVPPEARERIRAFLALQRAGAAEIDTIGADLCVHRLIDRLGLRRRHLFTGQADVVDQLRALARFSALAAAHGMRSPRAHARDFARSIAAVADQTALAVGDGDLPALTDTEEVQIVALEACGGLSVQVLFALGLGAELTGAGDVPVPDALLSEPLPADDTAPRHTQLATRLEAILTRATDTVVLGWVPTAGRPHELVEAARREAGAEWEEISEEPFSPDESLPASFRMLRDELMAGTTRAAGRLAELRLDTDLDVSHAVVRYLELLKVAALIARPDGQPLTDALVDVNLRIASAITAEQREIFHSSPLDEHLLDADRDVRRRARTLAARDEPSLARFLPLRDGGVMLSAGDIDTYRSCPLKYKFARVFRIPQEPTLHQRFGITVHQVLERFHNGEGGAGADGSLERISDLLENAWRRQGFGDSAEERQLRVKAQVALERFHAAAADQSGEPVWFERSFSFRLGTHLVRGRVDRVDRLPDGGYELIDYKTGRPRSPAALAQDVQLSLYTVAAAEAWGLEPSQGAYYYLLDDAKVAVPAGAERSEWIRSVAVEVAEGILAQEFEPTPSTAACGFCDYRLTCPAAER